MDVDTPPARRATRQTATVTEPDDLTTRRAKPTIKTLATANDHPALAYSLRQATERSLTRRRQEKLVELCDERSITLDGEPPKWAKKAMITALLVWRDRQITYLQQSPRLDSEKDSLASLRSRLPSQTATQRLAQDPLATPLANKASRASIQTHQHPPATPLLLEAGAGQPSPRLGQTEDDRLPPTPPMQQDEELPDLDSLQFSEKEVIPSRLLKKSRKIGSGGFKDVYAGRFGRFRVAIADMRGSLTPADVRELQLLRDLRHPNVVRFVGVCIPGAESEVPCQIVTELALNGDLFHYMRLVKPAPFASMLNIMIDIAKGVNYLHERTPAVIHRDLKSLNILVSRNGTVKIADFGLARVKQSLLSFCQTSCGTLQWQAPEMWTATPAYTKKIDVWASALIFWETLGWEAPSYPFEGLNEWAIFEAVGRKEERPDLEKARRQFGDDICKLIERMWAQAPEARPSMNVVLKELLKLRDGELSTRLSSATSGSIF